MAFRAARRGMMTNRKPFDLCWDRILRAEVHSDAAAKAWNAFIERDPYGVEAHVDADGSGWVSVRTTEPPPNSIALEIGEFLYQLRGALDASVYETACLNCGQRPPPDESKLEFPICDTPQSFENGRRKIRQLTPEQQKLIESVQPYNAPGLESADLPYNFNRGLGILNDWARKDRHRGLHVVASWASEIRPLLEVPRGTDLDQMTVTPSFLLRDETRVASFKLAGWQPGMNLRANPNLYLDIAIDDAPTPCHERDTLVLRLRCMVMAVSNVVNAIARTVGYSLPSDSDRPTVR
jgi:hypothetical protein